jgi:hypothetical protein
LLCLWREWQRQVVAFEEHPLDEALAEVFADGGVGSGVLEVGHFRGVGREVVEFEHRAGGLKINPRHGRGKISRLLGGGDGGPGGCVCEIHRAVRNLPEGIVDEFVADADDRARLVEAGGLLGQADVRAAFAEDMGARRVFAIG